MGIPVFTFGLAVYYVLKSCMLICSLKCEYEEYRVAFDSKLMSYHKTLLQARWEQSVFHIIMPAVL